LAGGVGDHEVKGAARGIGTARESGETARHVPHRHDVEARSGRGPDAQRPARTGGGGQAGHRADELEEQGRRGAARRVRRPAHHGARPEHANVHARALARGPDGRLGLELHALVGIVEVLAHVTLALEHRSRAPAAHVRGGEVGPRAKASAGQRLEEPHRSGDVAGAEALGVLGEEDRLACAVDHRVDGGAQMGDLGEAQAGQGLRVEICLHHLDIGGRQSRAQGGGDARGGARSVPASCEERDPPSGGEQPPRDRAADEARRPGDQDSSRAPAPHGSKLLETGEASTRLSRSGDGQGVPGGRSAGPRHRLA
jgi:hypothetical protein